MSFGAVVYVMLVAGTISLVVAVLATHRRRAPGAWPLVAINIAGAVWAFTTAFEVASISFDSAYFFHKLSFIGMGVLGVAWFAFAAQYSGRDTWLTLKNLAALSILPVVTQVLVWTNQYHGLVFTSLSLRTTESLAYLQEHQGVWWWIDSAYTYGLIAVGAALMLPLFVRHFGLYRRQIAFLLAAAVVPIVADLLYISGVLSSESVNLAPASFAWVGLVLYWGFTRYQLMDVTPVAREFVVENLTDSLVVTDTVDRVTYLNRAAERLLARELGVVAGMPLIEVLEGSPGLFRLYEQGKAQEAERSWEWRHDGSYYDGKVSTLRDSRGRIRGSVLVLRDTTDHKTAELALEEARSDLERRVQVRTAELAAERENLAGLYTFAVEIARCGTSAEVMSLGVKLACEAVKCDAGAIWVSSRNGRTHLEGSEGLTRVDRKGLRRRLETSTAVREAMASGQPICIGGLQGELSGGNAPEPDLQRVVVVPLVSRGLSLGALCLASARSDFGTRIETLSLAQAIAAQLAVALENVRRYEDAQFLAERDSLTRLLNYRGISKRLEQEVARCASSGATFGLVMIDVDNFKLFNDAYGHAVGDRALQTLARVLITSLRRSDAIARYGGDEFIAVLPDSSSEASVELVERIRSTLESTPFNVGGGRIVPIRMSYGVATYPDDGHKAAELLAAVDANLYCSKQRGGNVITSSGDDDFRPALMGSFSVLDGLVTTVDKKDHYTRQHSDDVTELAVALASKMGLSVETQRSVRMAGLLHDIGKVGVPDHILRKPAELNDEERKVVRNHVTLGELIIQGIPNQEEVVGAVGSHHERYDGKGYPRGLRGENIPLLGRILAVTDAYSAMTTDRPHRKALTVGEAKAELCRVAGTQLDPELVDAFLDTLEENETNKDTRTAA